MKSAPSHLPDLDQDFAMRVQLTMKPLPPPPFENGGSRDFYVSVHDGATPPFTFSCTLCSSGGEDLLPINK